MKDLYSQYKQSLKEGSVKNSRAVLDGIGVPTLFHGDVFTVYCGLEASFEKLRNEDLSFWRYKLTLPNGRTVEFVICRTVHVERGELSEPEKSFVYAKKSDNDGN